MNKFLHLGLVLVLIITLALSGCGGSSGGSNDNNITVTVNPGEVTMQPGDIQQFSATVTGTNNTAVTWSVEPQADGGSLDPLHPGKYQAPLTVGTYYVVATSQADPTKSGKAKVNVVAEEVIVVTYNSDIDGSVYSNGDAFSDLNEMGVGDRVDNVGQQALVSFTLNLPAGAQIKTAILRLCSSDFPGALYPSHILFEHLLVDFGVIDKTDFVGAPDGQVSGLTPCGEFSSLNINGWNELEVTASVREDQTAKRGKSQFRLYRNPWTDGNNHFDSNAFYTSEKTGYEPELVITYTL